MEPPQPRIPSSSEGQAPQVSLLCDNTQSFLYVIETLLKKLGDDHQGECGLAVPSQVPRWGRGAPAPRQSRCDRRRHTVPHHRHFRGREPGSVFSTISPTREHTHGETSTCNHGPHLLRISFFKLMSSGDNTACPNYFAKVL